ncbi:MAG: hypothetical protein K6T73_06270 [Candidatus Bathyarchaeota archaeon]|nr:hypothetical protein [Candidatus Bathyarchaeota archaeon]
MLISIMSIPIKLALQILEKIREEVDREMLNTAESIKKRMMEVQLMYELKKIPEKEYREIMKTLENRLRRLEEAQ